MKHANVSLNVVKIGKRHETQSSIRSINFTSNTFRYRFLAYTHLTRKEQLMLLTCPSTCPLHETLNKHQAY